MKVWSCIWNKRWSYVTVAAEIQNTQCVRTPCVSLSTILLNFLLICVVNLVLNKTNHIIKSDTRPNNAKYAKISFTKMHSPRRLCIREVFPKEMVWSKGSPVCLWTADTFLFRCRWLLFDQWRCSSHIRLRHYIWSCTGVFRRGDFETEYQVRTTNCQHSLLLWMFSDVS